MTRFLASKSGKSAQTWVIVIVTLALGVLAFVHRGVPAAEVDLNDGGVWVTNGSKRLVGHLNYESRALDGGLKSGVDQFDVSQFGTHVLVAGPKLVQPVDPATVAFTGESPVSDIEVAHGADLVLFADSSAGKVWVTDVAGSGSFNASAEPTIEKLDHPRVIVGTHGVGFVATADGAVHRVERGQEAPDVREIGTLDGFSPQTDLTVVGETLVGLEGGRLLTVDERIDVDGLVDGVLQQPSADRSEVVVAAPDALWRVPLGSGQPSRQETPKGTPSRPVALDGCAYGLWAGSGYYVRDCGSAENNEAAQFPQLADAEQPVFRTNRKAIVINDLDSGAVYLPLNSMVRVDDWDLVTSQVKERDKKVTSESDETELSQLQKFSEEQHPPKANDDEFGARPGTATTLPILINDEDPDGDVLTAVIKSVSRDVPITLAKEGRAVRIDMPANRTRPVTFTYRAFDGVDESANTASVTVRPVPTGANSEPERVRRTTLSVAERATVEYAALSDWIDPDGDPIYLEKAEGQEGLRVTWRPDGFVAARDLGTGGPGRRTIKLTVSDGTSSVVADLLVTVTAGTSNSPPVANNDHYVARVGEEITFRPLANDTDADEDELRLLNAGETEAGVTAKLDPQDQSVSFKASKAGNQTLVYEVSDGQHEAKAKIRVDVVDPDKADSRPAAENDLALLAGDGSVVVEPLLNDFDPAGGVLVLQGTSMGEADGLTVEVVRHSLLRISAPAGLKKPQTFSYTVSSGKASATASVLVLPLRTASRVDSPVAIPETSVVRAGDIVSVGVLANDYSPANLAIKLSPELDVRSDPKLGEFFVSDDQVRFRAGDQAGRAEAVYTIGDSEGNVASATVAITIRDFESRNQQPVPKPVTARTLAGGVVRIGIPMDGVDPDGDSVELIGVGSQGPRYGSVRVEGNYLAYQAAETSSGTDSFTYRVRDRLGAEADGLVRVGVAPAPGQNAAPVAVPDEMSARPGVRLEIPVTANDIDPDGDEILIVADSVRPVDARWDPQAEIQGQKVVATTPQEPGVYQLYYGVTDGGGVPATGVATLTVDENVPPVAPIAEDDYVPVNSIKDLESVDIDVLLNDQDPDGVVKDLEVTPDAPATVKGGTVTVPLAEDRQVILYTITDVDGLKARAALVVPGRDQIPPQLDATKVPAVVKAGEKLTVDLHAYVITRPGRQAKLTAVSSVVAGPGGDTTDADQGIEVVNDTTITFTPDAAFVGATSLTFKVTDGTDPEDPRGLESTLSLPITVTSAGRTPPKLRPTEIEVERGEKPREVSLSAMVDDPDPGDNAKMAYKLVSSSADVQAVVKGQQVLVSVPADAKLGSRHEIVVSVDDGTTPALKMTLPVTVTHSTRPLMTVSDIVEKEGRVGVAKTFDVSEVITNPFADSGGKIELVGNPSVTPAGSAEVTADGLKITVTPRDSNRADDAAESLVVGYTVRDATKDPARDRTGAIKVTVKGVPNAPTDVTADAQGSRTARVSWNHSGWRGGKPKGFMVSWSGGSKFCGLQTSCDIDTLANNNYYEFSVKAVVEESDIADSVASAKSNRIFVDVLPDVPAAPRAEFGDESIKLTWPETTVPDGGSPVTEYTLEVLPADTTGRTQQTVRGTSVTWPNLANGTAYSFRLTAHNRLTKIDPRVKAPRGPASAPETPAGKPSDQAAPTVAKDRAAVDVEPRATVTWNPPGNPNGDTSFRYQMRQKGTETLLHDGEGTSKTIRMKIGTENKTFEVRSTNKSDKWSEWSPASNAVRAFQPPGAPTDFTLTPTGVANEARFSFGNADGKGAKASEIRYRWSAGAASGWVSSGDTLTNAALVMGRDIQVQLTAVSTVNDETAEGRSAASTVNTYGAPVAPSVSAGQAGNGDVDLSWNASDISNGRRITEVEVRTTQSGTSSRDRSGNLQEGTGPNQTICITVRARNSEGQFSAPAERCSSTRGRGRANEWSGEVVPCEAAVSGPNGCRAWLYSLDGWYPRSWVTCTFTGTNNVSRSERLQVDGNGSHGRKRFLGSWKYAVGWPGFTEGRDVSDGCRYS